MSVKKRNTTLLAFQNIITFVTRECFMFSDSNNAFVVYVTPTLL